MSRLAKVTVHIEASILPHPAINSLRELEDQLTSSLSQHQPVFRNGLLAVPRTLTDSIQCLRVCDLDKDETVSFWQADLWIHLFRLSEQPPDCDYLEGEEDIPAAEQWELPSLYLRGLWEAIVVDEKIKKKLINYCCSSILFADAQVDANIISWNKMILLYGPPGTGKTSLCKALAQKVYIRNSHRYQTGLLFEVNAHSLFSKWFSESGKLVMKLFNHISEIAEDQNSLVVLLIDEVESIANARSAASKSGEPGDAVRVVNAVLTSLDSLKRKPNVLVLCTSNMVHSLDEAFLDRLDLKIHLGNPGKEARLQILRSCLDELEAKGILINRENQSAAQSFATLNHISVESSLALSASEADAGVDAGQSLLHLLAEKTENMSGRALRKLPLQAHAMLIHRPQISTTDFIQAMLDAVDIIPVEQTDSM